MRRKLLSLDRNPRGGSGTAAFPKGGRVFFEGGETRAVNASGSDDPSFRSLSAVGMTFLPKGEKAMARQGATMDRRTAIFSVVRNGKPSKNDGL